MLELYDNPEELTFPEDENSEKVSDKTAVKDKAKRELSDIIVLADNAEVITTRMNNLVFITV